MGTKFTYALVLTIAGAVFNLLLYFTGYQTEKLAVGQHLNWIGFVIMVVVLVLGIRAVREEAPDKALTFGRGVGAGVQISLLSGLMGGIYNFIHFKFINPEFVDYQMEIVRAKWEEVGMSAAQIEQAEGITRAMMGPVSQAIWTPLMALLVGTIVSLVAAALLRRPPATPPPVA